MKHGAWSERELIQLVDIYAVSSAKATAAALGRPIEAIYSAARQYGLSKAQQRPRQTWTSKELKLLRKLYPDARAAEVAKALGRDVTAVHGKAHKLGLRKSPQFYERERVLQSQQAKTDPGMISGRFHKGQTPANKGVRRPGWSCGRMAETQFKKGHKSSRTFPVGHVGPDPEGFLRIKIREPLYPNEPYTNYRPLYAKHVWEQAKGPVPPRHVFRYRDGNRANCAIENIEPISQRENRLRNSMWAIYPPALAKAIQLNGALKRKLRKQNAEKE